MTYKTIISNQPSCKTCGKLMKEWNPFAEEHEHPECTAERISEHMIRIIREQMRKTSTTFEKERHISSSSDNSRNTTSRQQ